MKRNCSNCKIEYSFKIEEIKEKKQDLILDCEGKLLIGIDCKAHSRFGEKDVQGILRYLTCPVCLQEDELSRRRI